MGGGILKTFDALLAPLGVKIECWLNWIPIDQFKPIIQVDKKIIEGAKKKKSEIVYSGPGPKDPPPPPPRVGKHVVNNEDTTWNIDQFHVVWM